MKGTRCRWLAHAEAVSSSCSFLGRIFSRCWNACADEDMREDGSEERIGEGRRSPTSLPGVTMVSEASRAGRPTAAAGRDGGEGDRGTGKEGKLQDRREGSSGGPGFHASFLRARWAARSAMVLRPRDWLGARPYGRRAVSLDKSPDVLNPGEVLSLAQSDSNWPRVTVARTILNSESQ